MLCRCFLLLLWPFDFKVVVLIFVNFVLLPCSHFLSLFALIIYLWVRNTFLKHWCIIHLYLRETWMQLSFLWLCSSLAVSLLVFNYRVRCHSFQLLGKYRCLSMAFRMFFMTAGLRLSAKASTLFIIHINFGGQYSQYHTS